MNQSGYMYIVKKINGTCGFLNLHYIQKPDEKEQKKPSLNEVIVFSVMHI